MNTSDCPKCSTSHNDTDPQDLEAALGTLRSELEHLWPEEETESARIATFAVSRAVGGLTLELDDILPSAA